MAAGYEELGLPAEALYPPFLQEAGLRACDFWELSVAETMVLQQADRSNLGQTFCGLLSRGQYICPTTDGRLQVFGAPVRPSPSSCLVFQPAMLRPLHLDVLLTPASIASRSVVLCQSADGAVAG